jgi:hypothetical protein
MKKLVRKMSIFVLLCAIVGLFPAMASAQAPVAPPIVVAVNDVHNPNSMSVYVDDPPYTSLTPLSGSPFQTNSIAQSGPYATSGIAQAAGTQGTRCTYVSDGLGPNGDGENSDIAVFRGTLSATHLVENFFSSEGLSGVEYGIGLSINGNYLYAYYSGSVIIEVLHIDPSTCKLTDTGHGVDASGPGLGIAVSITARAGNCLFATYGDGSVGSYKIGGGKISLVQQAFTGGNSTFGGIPAMAAVTKDGYVLFDDALTNGVLYDAYKIGSGCQMTSNRTSGPYFLTIHNSNTFVLAPDSSTIYTIGQASGTIQTNHYSGSGLVTETSCEDVAMNGFGTNFSFPGTGATPTTKGAGNGLFVAESSGGSGVSHVGAFLSFRGCLINGGQFQTDDHSIGAQYLITLAQPSQ